ncbi:MULTISPECIES: LysR substrate-binding domain-containing protein [Cobetia]|uniref:LysR family transcriptional regulator n=1 Tax=Cobetia crustatorum TaxID=553385 RepID=A0A558HS92_9GAMM|nr:MULTISPECIES: LysR substrate-binding domain-containing protein [Cobetia]TVU72007.1 LysR family transcriptional regulator [Cobetia crustatorum]
MRYSLRQLAVFVAVARHDNVSLAAESLAMSQSAASTALAELERQFDCRLFDRHGKRLRLNGLGRELLPKAIALLDQAEELEQLLGQQDATGSLEIGATLTIGNYLAPQIIGSFLTQHPASRVELHVHNTHQLIDKLVNFELDIGLIEGEVEHPLLEEAHWVSDRLSIFCAPSHPLAQGLAQGLSQEGITLDRLLATRWIMRERGSGTRSTFEQALRPHLDGPSTSVAQRLDIMLELEHTEAIKRAVEAGLGIGCISRLALRDAFRRGSLIEIPTPWLELTRAYRFVHHRDRFITQAMREFVASCRTLSGSASRSDEIVLPQVL